MKVEDTQYFAKLLEDVDEEMLSADEQKERKIMRLLLKIKNGTPPMRKVREKERGKELTYHYVYIFLPFSFSLPFVRSRIRLGSLELMPCSTRSSLC